MLFLSATSFLLLTPIGYALVICVDKYNTTSIIPCSNQNAIASTNMNTANATSNQGGNLTNTTTRNMNVSSENSTGQGNTGNPPSPNSSQSLGNTTPANIQLLFVRIDHTSGYIFTTHWVVWGKVANTGGTNSNPLTVQISCSNSDGAPLYSTTTSLTPSTLGPGETGTFSQPVSSDDLQGTKYDFMCTAQVVGQ